MSLRKDIESSTILVLGAGRSGMAAVRLLYRHGIPCMVADNSPESQMVEQRTELDDRGIPAYFGSISPDLLDETTLMVLSPGIPLAHDTCTEARTRGIPIISELELGYQFSSAPIVAISGTNGKTTTTFLITEILRQGGYEAVAAGNMGTPLSEVCLTPEANDENSVLVVEVSSFQLETIHEFKPYVALLLNISADHLDRYETIDDYVHAKKRLLMNLGRDDYFVANLDDAHCREFAHESPARYSMFSLSASSVADTFYDGNHLRMRSTPEDTITLCTADELRLRGSHNVANVLASAAVARIMDISPDVVRRTVTGFSPVEHRLEFVAGYRDIDVYNDSKATNVDSLEKALQSFQEPIVLICGGKNKKEDFKTLCERTAEKVKAAVTVGETSEHIISAWNPLVECTPADSMEEAVEIAMDIAEPGDIVLLSPGCPSLDWYKNFEQRGKDFKECVMEYMTGRLWNNHVKGRHNHVFTTK